MGFIQSVIEELSPEYFLDREGVSHKITYGSSGEQLNVKECPFCGDSRFKVYINAESGLGNCFVCDKKFGLGTFLTAFLDLPDRGIIRYFSDIKRETDGIYHTPIKRVVEDLPTQHLQMPESYKIPINGKNLRYLLNRGIDGATAEYFDLRFCHSGGFPYTDQYGRRRQQDYSNRIIIPIYDLERQFVSFQGRDITGTAEKKYLFPPGFASTGRYLYNGHNAMGAKRVVVGEGVFDVMALKMAVEHSEFADMVPVGTFGKHLSDKRGAGSDQIGEFLRLKEMGLREVYFMWDGSKDAIAAAFDAANSLTQFGLKTKVATLRDNKDPNEVSPEIVCDTLKQARATSLLNILQTKLR